jgi:hypothetical protein
MNPGASASGALQISLATINHQSGAGTPLEHMATEPASACIACHMPKSAAGNSPMHLWRINTDPGYVTMGATQANTSADGAYAAAAWVDVDLACGQCHGGGTVQDAQHQPVPPALYRTKAALATVAQGMHASAGTNYAVTFSSSVSSLTVTVDATVNCGADPFGVPLPCPPLAYDWTWGDGTVAHGSGDPATHTYAAGGTYPITLVVTLQSGGLQVSPPVTRGVTLTAPNQAPIAAGTCSWNGDTWTMMVTDTSSDPDDADPDHLQVVVDWGDGAKSPVPRLARPQSVTRVYTRVGTFSVSAKAADTRGLSSSYGCPTPATPTYFSISGTVKTAASAGIPAAIVVLKRGVIAVASKVTAADGTYAFPDLRPGTYSITVTKTGYDFGPAPQHPAVTVGGSKVADVTAVSAPSGRLMPRRDVTPLPLKHPVRPGGDHAN